jgi:hypothetical protein
MRFSLRTALLVPLACVAACSQSAPSQSAERRTTQPQAMYPVPRDAADFRHTAIQPGVYEQDSFAVAEPYPAASALDHYRRVLSDWIECDYGGPDWTEIEDWSGGERRRVQQRSKAWLSPKNDTFVIVALMYVHHLDDPVVRSREMPQQVYLTRRTTADAADELKGLGVTCGSGT